MDRHLVQTARQSERKSESARRSKKLSVRGCGRSNHGAEVIIDGGIEALESMAEKECYCLLLLLQALIKIK